MFRRRIVYFVAYSHFSHAPYWRVIFQFETHLIKYVLYKTAVDVSKRIEEIDLLLERYKNVQDVNKFILNDQFANSNPEMFSKIYKENKKLADEIYKLKKEKEGLI